MNSIEQQQYIYIVYDKSIYILWEPHIGPQMLHMQLKISLKKSSKDFQQVSGRMEK